MVGRAAQPSIASAGREARLWTGRAGLVCSLSVPWGSFRVSDWKNQGQSQWWCGSLGHFVPGLSGVEFANSARWVSWPRIFLFFLTTLPTDPFPQVKGKCPPALLATSSPEVNLPAPVCGEGIITLARKSCWSVRVCLRLFLPVPR